MQALLKTSIEKSIEISIFLLSCIPGISELVLAAVELAEGLLRPVLRVLGQVQDLGRD